MRSAPPPELRALLGRSPQFVTAVIVRHSSTKGRNSSLALQTAFNHSTISKKLINWELVKHFYFTFGLSADRGGLLGMCGPQHHHFIAGTREFWPLLFAWIHGNFPASQSQVSLTDSRVSAGALNVRAIRVSPAPFIDRGTKPEVAPTPDVAKL